MSATLKLLVGTKDGSLYLNVCGEATHRVTQMADLVVREYAEAHEAPWIVVDVSACPFLDSTFAGWLMGVRKRLGARGGAVQVANLSEVAHDSLARMHLLPLLKIVEFAPPAECRSIPFEPLADLDRRTMEIMLEAHAELAAIDEENARVFEPIATMLKQKLAELDS